MKDLSAALDSSFTAAAVPTHGATPASSASTPDPTPLDLVGSDGRLEVVLSHQSLDLSGAITSAGVPPVAPFTMQVHQLFGHYQASSHLLGSYHLQVSDSQGRVVSGIALTTPLLLRYHYQPQELTSLQLDPGLLMLSWPGSSWSTPVRTSSPPRGWSPL